MKKRGIAVEVFFLLYVFFLAGSCTSRDENSKESERVPHDGNDRIGDVRQQDSFRRDSVGPKADGGTCGTGEPDVFRRDKVSLDMNAFGAYGEVMFRNGVFPLGDIPVPSKKEKDK